MNNEKKILDYISNKYKIKVSSKTKIFNEIDIDSFEFVIIVNELEKN